VTTLPAVLVLYHRHGCHLCERMLARLRHLQAERGFDLDVRDVDADPDLARRFNDEVPLLQGEGAELSRYLLDEEALTRYLDKR
jgi:thioredoxin reductase (NADPH)